MGCQNITESKTRTVWARADKTPIVVPFHTVSTDRIAAVRASFFQESQTGTVEVRPVVQYSNDGVVWGAFTALSTGGKTTPDDWEYGPSFDTLDTAYRYARFGVFSNRTTTGTDVYYTNVTLTLDLLEA